MDWSGSLTGFVVLVKWVGSEIVNREGKSSLFSLVRAFDTVLAVYEGFCNLKQVGFLSTSLPFFSLHWIFFFFCRRICNSVLFQCSFSLCLRKLFKKYVSGVAIQYNKIMY